MPKTSYSAVSEKAPKGRTGTRSDNVVDKSIKGNRRKSRRLYVLSMEKFGRYKTEQKKG